jgi:hypothetical protein
VKEVVAHTSLSGIERVQLVRNKIAAKKLAATKKKQGDSAEAETASAASEE